MKKQLKKIFSLLIIFMAIDLNSQTVLINSEDKLSIPLPLPYDGAIYSEIDVKKFKSIVIKIINKENIFFNCFFIMLV